MYNEERKQQFINEKKQTAILSGNITDFFRLSERFEERYGRDICEWSTSEIIDIYKYYSSSSVQTLVQLNNSLRMYVDWCINNGLVPDNQNHFAEIRSEMLCECIDMHQLRGRIVSRDEILGYIRELPNFVDQFILLGLFEGLPVKDELICRITIDDLDDDGNIVLKNGNRVAISPQLRSIMFNASVETEAEPMVKDWSSVQRIRVTPYLPGDQIVRCFDVKRGLAKPIDHVGRRVRACGKFLDKNFTIKSLMESGRLWYIKQMVDKYGITLEQAFSEREMRDKHEAIYGPVQNSITYIGTYGQFFNEFYT